MNYQGKTVNISILTNKDENILAKAIRGIVQPILDIKYTAVQKEPHVILYSAIVITEVVMQDIKSLRLCDPNCKYLNPKEKEQTYKKEFHYCKKFKKRVYHKGRHPYLVSLDECEADCILAGGIF